MLRRLVVETHARLSRGVAVLEDVEKFGKREGERGWAGSIDLHPSFSHPRHKDL